MVIVKRFYDNTLLNSCDIPCENYYRSISPLCMCENSTYLCTGNKAVFHLSHRAVCFAPYPRWRCQSGEYFHQFSVTGCKASRPGEWQVSAAGFGPEKIWWSLIERYYKLLPTARLTFEGPMLAMVFIAVVAIREGIISVND